MEGDELVVVLNGVEKIVGNQTALKTSGEKNYGDYSSSVVETLQRIEAKNQVPMDGVNIRFQSAAPAEYGAKAIAYGGRNVEIAPGAESALNHELGHIVQQRLGLVKETGKINGRPVNDKASLEQDATRRGAF